VRGKRVVLKSLSFGEGFRVRITLFLPKAKRGWSSEAKTG
jgi:hypothetical protein